MHDVIKTRNIDHSKHKHLQLQLMADSRISIHIHDVTDIKQAGFNCNCVQKRKLAKLHSIYDISIDLKINISMHGYDTNEYMKYSGASKLALNYSQQTYCVLFKASFMHRLIQQIKKTHKIMVEYHFAELNDDMYVRDNAVNIICDLI